MLFGYLDTLDSNSNSRKKTLIVILPNLQENLCLNVTLPDIATWPILSHQIWQFSFYFYCLK